MFPTTKINVFGPRTMMGWWDSKVDKVLKHMAGEPALLVNTVFLLTET